MFNESDQRMEEMFNEIKDMQLIGKDTFVVWGFPLPTDYDLTMNTDLPTSYEVDPGMYGTPSFMDDASWIRVPSPLKRTYPKDDEEETNNKFLRRICELERENSALTSENSALKSENCELKSIITRLTGIITELKTSYQWYVSEQEGLDAQLENWHGRFDALLENYREHLETIVHCQNSHVAPDGSSSI